MYKRQNKILFISLIGLLTLTTILYSKKEKNSFSIIDKSIYKIDNLADIDKITLQSYKHHIVLRYDGLHWIVNNKDKANTQLITVLFATLKEVEPKRLVSHVYIDSIRKHIHNTGVLVSLYKGESKVKEFYTGGNLKKTKAYFQDSKNGPHLISIPGYHVYASGIFEVDEQGWKSRRIFDFNWHNFKKLSFISRRDSTQNFDIAEGKYGFRVITLTQTDTTKLHDYLNAISLLEAHQFISPKLSKPYDSLMHALPLVQITVWDVGNNTYSLTLYPPLSKDKNMVGKQKDNTTVLFKRTQVIPILKTKDYFKPK